MAEKRLYEGMFLVDAGQDFETATQPIHTVLGRGEAEIVAIKPWDERRLAYDIAGRKRGLYVLVYFKMDPANLAEVEHDVQLNEHLLRALFLRKEGLSDEIIHAETPAMSSRRSEDAEPSGAAGEGKTDPPAPVPDSADKAADTTETPAEQDTDAGEPVKSEGDA